MKVSPLLPAALLAFLPALGDSVTLTSTADTGMMSLNPNNNMGRLATVPVGALANQAGHKARALFRFDPAALIPPGSVVTNVTLRLNVSKEASSGTADTVGLHRMIQAWGEGTKTTQNNGSSATAGEASWNWRQFNSATWGEPGGQADVDFAASPSATVTWNNPGAYTFPSSPALVADVQSWIDAPASNQGWMVKSTDETGRTGKRIVTHDSSSTTQKPQLIVQYTPPSTDPVLQSIQLSGTDVDLIFRIEAGNLYDLRAYESPGSSSFLVLTNYASKFESFETSFKDPANLPRRFYQLVITGQID